MNYTEEQNRNFKILSLDFDKKIDLNLVGLNGNAFSLMSAFRRAASKQGWEQDEIEYVMWQCQQDDYNHLLNTLMEHTTPFDEDEYDEY